MRIVNGPAAGRVLIVIEEVGGYFQLVHEGRILRHQIDADRCLYIGDVSMSVGRILTVHHDDTGIESVAFDAPWGTPLTITDELGSVTGLVRLCPVCKAATNADMGGGRGFDWWCRVCGQVYPKIS